MINKVLLFLVVIILTHIEGYSQILNAEKFFQEVDSSKKMKSNIDLTYKLDQQKELINKFGAKINSTVKLKRSDATFALKANFLYASSKGLVNKGFSHIRYRHKSNKKIAIEFYGQYQWDGIRGLESRILYGSNLRYKIQSDSLGKINIGIGVMHENEIWNYSGVKADSLFIDDLVKTKPLKYNFYFGAYRELSKSISTGITFYLQNKFDIKFNPRFAGIYNINLKFNEFIRLSLAIDWFYDVSPVVPIQNLYYTLQNKITLSF